MCRSTVRRLGYFVPFAVLAGVTTTIACGLISTWNPDTPPAIWIIYQMLYGLRGMGLQMGIIACQSAVTSAESPSVIAFLFFAENLVSAVFTIAGGAVFTQTLQRRVAILAPSVSPRAALASGGGAEAVRSLLPSGSPELPGLLLAFSDAVIAVYYLLMSLGVVSFGLAWAMGWVDIRKKTARENELRQD
ncbi:MFS-type transporter calB [Fulvia fulva]|uniref:MFS-type transporter calB n=1 Tax=Passalora fulva TaxID=5499 RepID=A0A9Q8P7X6_PASFU|nr:MFS-type transporter calB [Fulvia fulva]UJO16352.1 MFS-type transporter calB [Fulvia fulva]